MRDDMNRLLRDGEASVITNPYLMAKTGQLSLMRTTQVEVEAAEPPAIVEVPDQEMPTEQAA